MTNYYFTLGLKDFASLEEIKKAYRKLSKKFHPDHNDGDTFFEEKFKEVQNAYEHLTDHRLRTIHDEVLKKYYSFDNSQYFQASETQQNPKQEQQPEEESPKETVNPKVDVKFKFPSLRVWHFLLLIPLFLILYFSVLKTSSKLEVTNGSGKLYYKYIFEGQATNSTFNKTSEASLEMLQLLNNQYECLGRFDEINLFGRFDIIGKIIRQNDDSLVVDFKGSIYFVDGDGSGLKNGTNTSFHLSLTVLSNSAIGNYIIDEIPNSEFSKVKQAGVLKLNVKSKLLVPRIDDR